MSKIIPIALFAAAVAICSWTAGHNIGAGNTQKAQLRHLGELARTASEVITLEGQVRDLEAVAQVAIWACAGELSPSDERGPWTMTRMGGGWYEARITIHLPGGQQ